MTLVTSTAVLTAVAVITMHFPICSILPFFYHPRGNTTKYFAVTAVNTIITTVLLSSTLSCHSSFLAMDCWVNTILIAALTVTQLLPLKVDATG